MNDEAHWPPSPRSRDLRALLASLPELGRPPKSTASVAIDPTRQVPEMLSSMFLTDELLHMRKEIREQAALLHAKLGAIERLETENDARAKALADRVDSLERRHDEARLGFEKMLHALTQSVEAKLGTPRDHLDIAPILSGLDALEQRVAAQSSLQSLNEDLGRLKLHEKQAAAAELDHQFQHLADQISREARCVAAVATQHDQLVAKMSELEAAWHASAALYDSRITQTLELANALNAGQGLLEEAYKLETQKTIASLRKHHDRVERESSKLHAAHDTQLLQLEVLSRELHTMRDFTQRTSDELKDVVIGVRMQSNSNTSALRTLAEEILKLKRHRAEEFRRASFEELQNHRDDTSDDVVTVLNKALLQSSYAAFVPTKRGPSHK
ncbi:hypothetical protein SDRG_14484 [Saprolegnia diclina VS20]|uniref:Uncharacterized protein n=1 Tax=Saprolegnia diclina (strain VS20) TaxID=1156394 RepID=T0R6P7_SAPDV|nr:hypothetical protein SDRG_14484 [Saprolegnia diclina VS20]EQC27733.1 hypothetical protein SDRG_14484 [Saprolegnia diclina VS20]|eukprot:XP_008618838.1 hypothetical protein SDRG_14484 [Saprolegnia diclina VS20]